MNRTVGGFILRRWLRIAPVYYLGIIIYSVLPWLFSGGKAPHLGILVANLTFINGWWPGQSSSMVPGGWSISAEIAFYCLLPWAAIAVTSFRRAIVGYCVVLLASQLVGYWLAAQMIAKGFQEPAMTDFMEYCPIWHLPTFSLGLVLYFVRPLVRPKLGWLLIFMGAVLFLCVPYTIGRYHSPRSIAVGIPLFVLSLGVTTIVDSSMFFKFSSLRWLGTVSYGVYLMHFWVLDIVVTIVVFAMTPLEFSGLYMFLTSLFGTVLLSSAIAALNRRYIEMPALSLADNLFS